MLRCNRPNGFTFINWINLSDLHTNQSRRVRARVFVYLNALHARKYTSGRSIRIQPKMNLAIGELCKSIDTSLKFFFVAIQQKRHIRR